MNDFAKTLILFGLLLVVLGLFLSLFPKLPGLGKIPGDIFIRKGSFSFYFPIGTCILISLILTAVLTFFGKK